MKKITLFFMMFGLMASTTCLTAQTYYSVAMNGGTVYASNPGSFAGYPWGGVPNYSFNNSNSSGISLHITNYDETNPSVGPELFINFSRVGFGNAPLNWGNDNATTLATLTPSDFTAGEATVVVDIPAGYLPVELTADYVAGYLYILQVVGANPSGDQTYINFVSTIEEEILSTNDFNKSKLAAFYNANLDAIVFDSKISGDYSIYDLTGRVISKGAISNEISTASLKGGAMYILSTESGVLKFVK
ncbi:hypothetical protein GCM10023314_02820 [Algibacter agarivorans]|uniref:Por secretion system C-terminal sorting domain-containing protein n=1 Tax=Algibacter agarivorans TaxID=1109741 RepID=A0ABP9GA17_9FLAO